MTCPKMIVFDYGDTLLCEPDFDTLRGDEALSKYVTVNKNNLTPKDVNDFSQKLFAEIGAVRQIGIDLHEWQFQRLLYEYLEIELSISLPAAERVFWDNTSAGAVMPGADRMLDYINARGIRSGVISNIGFSGAALTERINRLLPNNNFEFVIASSEYMFRKPSRYLFELALKKAGLDIAEVWFCGDNVEADVEGAAAVGMYPVWYECLTVGDRFRVNLPGQKPNCEHLHIHAWDEMIEVLEGMK